MQVDLLLIHFFSYLLVSITQWGFQSMLLKQGSMVQVQMFALSWLCFFVVFNDETWMNA